MIRIQGLDYIMVVLHGKCLTKSMMEFQKNSTKEPKLILQYTFSPRNIEMMQLTHDGEKESIKNKHCILLFNFNIF